MEIWIVRHGESEGNLNRIIQGQQPGSLSEAGVLQAKQTGKALTALKFEHVYVSDLRRAYQTYETMELMFPQNDVPITYTSLIREKSGGVLEGHPLSEWFDSVEKAGMSAREYKPAEGESWEIVMHRADAFLTFLIDTFLRFKKPDLIELESKFAIKHSTISQDNPEDDFKKHQLETKQQNEQQAQISSEKPEEKKANPEEVNTISVDKRTEDSNSASSSFKKKSSYSLWSLLCCCSSNSKSPETKAEPAKKILVVTHGGFIMEFFNALNFRIDRRKPDQKNDIMNCSVSVVRVDLVTDGKEQYKIIKKNNVIHMKYPSVLQ